MLKYKSVWREEPMDAVITQSAYANNGRMYLGLWCKEEDYFEPWTDITVNLFGPITDENCAFVDNNNCPDIVQFLEQSGLAVPTGRVRQSGWCVYPEYRFNMDEVRKHLAEEL